MKNAEWIIKTGHNFKQLRLIQHNELASRSYTVMLCDEPIAELNDKKEPLDVFRKWLDAEHKEPILDDTERQYLSAVIKPFRDRVEFISKVVMDYQGGYTDCYICIRFTDSSNDMSFPVFCETDMYKGMKLYEKYTLEELGL
jgi:hypothetical protein